MKTKLTIENVRERISKTFGDSFDFPNLAEEFVSGNLITMVCPIHGPTKKQLKSIINSKTGCSLCRHLKKTLTEFLGKQKSPEELRKFYAFIKEHGINNQSGFTTKIHHEQVMMLYKQFRLKSGYHAF